MPASASDEYGVEVPPAVQVPDGNGWRSGAGMHHASPNFAMRRRCGDGAAFTPVREDSRSNMAKNRRLPAPLSWIYRAVEFVLNVLNSVAVQTLSYLIFVGVFQMLTESLRLREEFHFDKFISDTFIENHFDSQHNNFGGIRRVADVYEWGNQVLLPGLFANAGPCSARVGAYTYFESATDRAVPTNLSAALAAKGCNDDGWADGEGSFHLHDQTAWSVEEVANQFDVLDWSEVCTRPVARILPPSRHR